MHLVHGRAWTSRLAPTALCGLVAGLLAGLLAGCAATGAVSYGEYQFGPGYESERVYERRFQAGPGQDFSGEACDTATSRAVDAFGNVVERDSQVCDDPQGLIEIP